jgi:ribonuclease P protein component
MRLSRSADFDRVFRHGRSHASRELVLYVFPRGGEADEPRLGLSVSRKVGGAVQRNRVKRLLREAFALEGRRLPAGTDAVVVARHEVNALAEREGLDGIRRALSGLLDKAAPAASSGPVTEAKVLAPSAAEAPPPSTTARFDASAAEASDASTTAPADSPATPPAAPSATDAPPVTADPAASPSEER